MLIEWLLKLASFCFAFFALGHSLGHISRNKIEDPEAQQVLLTMRSYRYNLFGKRRTYDENYIGMSLNLIATLLFLSIGLFYSSRLVVSQPSEFISAFVALSFILSSVFCVTSFRYFFVIPGATCLVASASLLTALILLIS